RKPRACRRWGWHRERACERGGTVSVIAAPGFLAAGATGGLKASGRPDVALVVNTGPSRAAAGVFTGNRVQAAPVRWCRSLLDPSDGGQLAAVVPTAAGANACAGPGGAAAAAAAAAHAAAALTAGAHPVAVPQRVAVCATGLIGERLPMSKLLAGIDS